MYRILIVDDEPIIVEGLFDLFNDLTEIEEFDVYAAYSGEEALDLLKRTKMDIVLTDIEMPGMNGLELHCEIKQYWPHCKVIFLTGYNDFEYAQSAIRNGGSDYVLKTEGDEQIVHTVMKVIESISKELEVKKLIESANEKMQLALPYQQKEYLMDLLQGILSPSELKLERLLELKIPLDTDIPLFMVVGRVDRWHGDVRPSEKGLLLFAIHNIAEEYLSSRVHMAHVTYQHDRWAWLMQPILMHSQSYDWTTVTKYVQGSLESIQTQSKKLLRIPCSFVIESAPFHWGCLPEKFDLLKWRLNLGLGIGEEMLLTDASLSQQNRQEKRIHFYASKINQLETLLESGQQDEFNTDFAVLVQEVSSIHSQKNDMIYEIYYSLVVMFLSCLNRWDLMTRISAEINMSKLTKIEEHASWLEISDYFSRIAELFFEHRKKEYLLKTNDVVGQIHEYVNHHLDGDLSQSKLAETVYLSASYLSRLYKQTTGLSLSEYIMDAKMNKAKQLLKESQLRIHDIAAEVGFESASYFTRFFKKVTHLTPQEFREKSI